MRHIITILLQNEAGALARVANAFAARGYNIDSLSVAPTHEATVSRLTLVTTGSDAVIEQIIKQTRKLIDVVEIADLSSSDHIECELLMAKVEVNAESARKVVECVREHRAQILDESDDTRMIQLAGTGSEIDALVSDLGRISTILEVDRSGVAAMARGRRIVTVAA
ncbi:MAG TPA: acetolactate synthase small subunit [Solimonas sp.]|nr:acetolactate synthase small subunit [Solimonas sp.]